jgi:hypothetical protein
MNIPSFPHLGVMRLHQPVPVVITGLQEGVYVTFAASSAEAAVTRRELIALNEGQSQGWGSWKSYREVIPTNSPEEIEAKRAKKAELSEAYKARLAADAQQVLAASPDALRRMAELQVDLETVRVLRFDTGLAITGDALALLREPDL